MSSTNKNIVKALDEIFATNEKILKNHTIFKSHKTIPNEDLEIALTVLLVDLASCDQNFDQKEYQVISNGLYRMFGTTRAQVQKLVNQAMLTINGMRGVDHFAKLLKTSLPEEDKQIVLDLIKEIIHADDVEDTFELYLQKKFVDLLN